MKKIILTALALGCMSIGFTALAQDDIRPEQKEKREKKGQQEIIIRSKGDSNVTLKIEINGDNVLVNGKTLLEFKDDDITINKRKIMYRDGDGNMNLDFDGLEGLGDLQSKLQSLQWDKANLQFDKANKQLRKMNRHRTFLGVTTEKTGDGAKIVEVVKGSAAEKAGLQKDDVIMKIDKQAVTDEQVLADIIGTKKPKDVVKVYYKRAGKNKDAKVVLGESKDMTMNFNFKQSPAIVRSFSMPRINNDNDDNDNDNDNASNYNITDDNGVMANMFPRQKKLGLKIQDTEEGGNVKIIDVEDSSAAQKAGLQKDDIITEINGEKVANTDEAREQLQEAAEKSTYTIKALRSGSEKSFEIKFPKKLKTANL